MIKPFFTGIFICLLFTQLTFKVHSQFYSNPTTGVTSVQNGLWSVMNNPAGLATESKFGAGFYYQSAFLMYELANAGFALSFPVGNFSIVGLNYQQYGYSLYKEQQAGLTISKQLGKSVAAGIRLDYLSIAFGNDYGNASLFTGSAGVLLSVTENLRIGVSVFNPQKAKYGKQIYDAKMTAGLAWRFGDHVELSLGAEKEGSFEEQLICALDYVVNRRFSIRAGVSNGTQPIFFGYAFRFSNVEIAMQSGYHQLLGFSPQFSFTYKRK